MKHIFNIVLVTVLIMSSLTVSAQSLKIGHINSAKLMTELPKIKKADTDLQTYAQQKDAQLKGMLNEYQSMVQEYTTKEPTMENWLKEAEQQKIITAEQKIQEFQQTAQQQIADKKEELYGPVLEEVQKAIDVYAKANGYTYILDVSLGSVLFGVEANDLTDKIKASLGI